MTSYPLMEIFCSLQGEGVHAGKPAVFIRLGGCDVGCVWCDVKDSWDKNLHPEKSIKEILSDVNQFEPSLIIITGGEPLMYDLTELTVALKNSGKQLHLETSGAYPVSGVWDWICVSPKKFKAPLNDALLSADELKVVVYNKTDFEWAEKHAKKVSPACALLLQPEWGRSAKMLPSIISFAEKNPAWRVSLQQHKFLGLR